MHVPDSVDILDNRVVFRGSEIPAVRIALWIVASPWAIDQRRHRLFSFSLLAQSCVRSRRWPYQAAGIGAYVSGKSWAPFCRYSRCACAVILLLHSQRECLRNIPYSGTKTSSQARRGDHFVSSNIESARRIDCGVGQREIEARRQRKHVNMPARRSTLSRPESANRGCFGTVQRSKARRERFRPRACHRKGADCEESVRCGSLRRPAHACAQVYVGAFCRGRPLFRFLRHAYSSSATCSWVNSLSARMGWAVRR